MTTSATEQAASSETSEGGAAPTAADTASGAGAETSSQEGGASTADADDGNNLAAQNAELQETIQGLKEQLRGVVKERDDFKKSGRSTEQRLADLEKDAEEGRRLKRLAAIDKTVGQIAHDVPEKNRKLAKAVLKSLQGDEFDFAAEESRTVEGKKAALKHLKAEYPELFVEPSEDVNIPRHIKTTNGVNVSVEAVGVPKSEGGNRLL